MSAKTLDFSETSEETDRSSYVRRVIQDLLALFLTKFLSLAFGYPSGSGCSKLMMSLVNDSLKFQKSVSNIRQYFLLKKMREAFAVQSFSHFFNKKYQYVWLQSRKTVDFLTSSLS